MELTLDQALQKGIEAHKAGQVQEADRLYTAILKAQPKHPDANHNMGIIAVGVGKVEQALPFFKTALEANPNTAQFWLSYIDALIKLDRLADAQALFDQAKSNGVKGDSFDVLERRLNVPSGVPVEAVVGSQEIEQVQPNILDSLKLDQAIKLAKTNVKKGSPEEAKRIYQDVLVKFPKNKRAIGGLKGLAGVLVGKASKVQRPPQDQLQSLINLYSQGQLKQALEQATLLFQQFPNSSILYNICGAAYKGLGQLDASVEAYRKALAIKPDYADAYNNMGITLKDQGKLEEAIEAFNKALAIKIDYASAHNNMGNALKEQGKLEEAIEAFNKALAIKTDYADAYNNMGIALTEQGKLEEAIETFNKALAVKLDYAEAYNNMGNALKEQGKLEEAIEAYNQALTIKPEYAEAYNNMGNALQEQGKLEEALEAFNKALAIKPDYAEAFNNMGITLKDQGKLEEAIEAYNKAIAIKPDYAASIFMLGKSFKQLGLIDESIKYFNQAISLDPEDNLGAELELVSLGQKNTPPKTPQNFMKEFYRKKSNTWGKDKKYNGHLLIENAFTISVETPEKINILDLGCGTGSLACFLRPYAKTLDGLDLSPDMIKIAGETGLYDSLIEHEIETHLAKISIQYDVIVAAAVLVHFYDLQNILSLIWNRLKKNGKLIFSVFEGSVNEKELNDFLMYAHSDRYITNLASSLSFQVNYRKNAIHEYHSEKPVSALVYVFQKIE